MDKNKISLTIIKTTLTVTIAFCLVSSILGLVSLYSFKQMVETEIRLSGYGLMVSSNVTEKFASVSAETISTVYIVFVLIALNILHLPKFLIKKEKVVKILNCVVSAICAIALIAAIILCINVIKQSFDLVNDLPQFNSFYTDSKDYYSYMYFQSYQSSALSMAIPFIVASILSVLINITNFFPNCKKTNKNLMAQQQQTQTD